MPVPARGPGTTAEELFLLADDGSRTELVKGEIVHMTPAGARHGAVTVRIGRLLDEYVEAHGLGVCCGAETGFILRRSPDTVRAPNAAVVVTSHVPAPGLPDGFWPCAPDLAVEVVSPWDRRSRQRDGDRAHARRQRLCRARRLRSWRQGDVSPAERGLGRRHGAFRRGREPPARTVDWYGGGVAAAT